MSAPPRFQVRDRVLYTMCGLRARVWRGQQTAQCRATVIRVDLKPDDKILYGVRVDDIGNGDKVFDEVPEFDLAPLPAVDRLAALAEAG